MDRLYTLLHIHQFILTSRHCTKQRFITFIECRECVCVSFFSLASIKVKGHWDHVDTQVLILVCPLLFNRTKMTGPLNIY